MYKNSIEVDLLPFGAIEQPNRNVQDLTIPPSNKLEKKKGDVKDYYSIRINDQWRIIFKWSDGNASEVEIIDYH